MPKSRSHGMTPPATLRFYVTPRQPLGPGAILLALAIALGVLYAILHLVNHAHGTTDGGGMFSSGSDGSEDDDKDDPSRVDTIYLGDPADAPVPAKPGPQPGTHAGTVHPFVIVRLPRSGDDVGRIPDTAAGHLLYGWLAAFNQSNEVAIARSLPHFADDATMAAQMELRQQTGGFALLSAREVQPGLLVFRLRSQAAPGSDVLGTLQMVPKAKEPAIASFSLREVPQAVKPGP